MTGIIPSFSAKRRGQRGFPPHSGGPWMVVACLIFSRGLLWAGPPYVSDDPETVELDHWEIFLASTSQRAADESNGSVMQLDLNYGALTDVQLKALVPLAYDKPAAEPVHVGLGDIELGVKWRFLHESDSSPQVALYPTISLPSGNSRRGLGSGYDQVFLPIWAQKSMGAWTIDGGGGYWINPGSGNRNYWYMGAIVQRKILESLSLGAEVFHSTPNEETGSGRTGFTVGGTYDVSDLFHVVGSIGRDVSGNDHFSSYVGVQMTW